MQTTWLEINNNYNRYESESFSRKDAHCQKQAHLCLAFHLGLWGSASPFAATYHIVPGLFTKLEIEHRMAFIQSGFTELTYRLSRMINGLYEGIASNQAFEFFSNCGPYYLNITSDYIIPLVLTRALAWGHADTGTASQPYTSGHVYLPAK